MQLDMLSEQCNSLLNAAKSDFAEQFSSLRRITQNDMKEISNSDINTEGFSVWVEEGYAQRVRLYVIDSLLARSNEELLILDDELVRAREFYVQVSCLQE